MAQIFLSYSHSDGDFVELIEPRIERIFGKEIMWYDRSPDGLKGGDIWWSEILRQIQYCQIFLFLLSDESGKSEWCTKELKEAILLNKTLIPVFLETYSTHGYPEIYSEEMQRKLEETQFVDLRNSHSRIRYDDLSPLWGAINRAQRPELTITERWMLWNQYELLRHTRGDHVADELLGQTREQYVLSSGFERHYFEILPFVKDEVSPYNDGEEVQQILDMFYMITNALTSAGRNSTAIEVSDEDKEWLTYRGFRENGEFQHYHYAKFLCKNEGLFKNVIDQVPDGFDLNSYMARLPEYRRMLTAWRQSKDRFCLTREDLLRIADAGKPLHWEK